LNYCFLQVRKPHVKKLYPFWTKLIDHIFYLLLEKRIYLCKINKKSLRLNA
jgi:hypothetical protein